MADSLLQKIFKASKADNFILIKEESNSSHIRFANSDITSSGNVLNIAYFAISIINQKIGIYSADGITSFDDIIKAMKKSEEIAIANERSDDYFELVGENDAAQKVEKSFVTEFNLNTDNSIALLTDKVDYIQNNLIPYNAYGFARSQKSNIFVANSKGLRKTFNTSYSSITLTTKTKDSKSSTWVADAKRNLSEIDEKLMVRSSTSALGFTKSIGLIPGDYEVILSPNAVCDMLIYLVGMMTQRDADEGRSPFSSFSKNKIGNKIGSKLFPEFISVYTDPDEKFTKTLPFLAASSNNSYSSIFDNGAQIQKQDFIREGVLRNLISTRKYAKEKKLKSFCLYPFSISMDGSDKSVDDLVSQTKKGLYITSLWYIRLVNPITGLLTGLTRDGVYVIEDGKIIGKGNNFRFNESPIEMLQNTIDLSKSFVTIPREFDGVDELFYLPSLKIRNFHMSSLSDAI